MGGCCRGYKIVGRGLVVAVDKAITVTRPSGKSREVSRDCGVRSDADHEYASEGLKLALAKMPPQLLDRRDFNSRIHHSPYMLRTTTESSDSLCVECESLQLLPYLNGDLKLPPHTQPRLTLYHGHTLCLRKDLALVQVEAWRTSRCPVCRFLFAIIQETLYSTTTPLLSGYQLRIRVEENPLRYRVLNGSLTLVRATLAIAEEDYGRISGAYFGICASGPEIQRNCGASVRKLEVDQIDFELLSRWVRECRSSHQSSLCNRDGEELVENLRVIDCLTRRIVYAASGGQYVALSYVWGSHNIEAIDLAGNDYLAPRIPRTIEDAMKVTLQLGFQYLWVDRYCIPQGSIDFHNQIKQMDRIYMAAQVTLFAASGEGPDAGLPGVSTALRSAYHTTTISNTMLASLPWNPRQAIERSKWASRAWTFQEAVFARRRLFFVDEQVIFECAEMQCLESMHPPMVPNLELPICEYPACGISPEPWSIASMIEKYNWRVLTYETDILNAFSGVLQAYKVAEHPVFNFWGVPILPPVAKSETGEVVPIERTSLDGFVLGLCWTWSDNLLQYEHSKRPDFPTWSWAGWKWTRRFFRAYYEGKGHWHAKTDINISIELGNGTLLSWAAFETAGYPEHDILLASRFLHIDAWTVKIRLGYDKFEEEQGLDVDGYVTNNLWVILAIPDQDENMNPRWKFQLSLHGQRLRGGESSLSHLQSRQCIGIVMGDAFASGSRSQDYPFVMVVEDRGNYYERVGSTSFGFPYKCADPRDDAIHENDLVWTFDSFKLERRRMRIG
ncbi:HET-domain-containing protein [Tothia fuscella]|uniref:HET-domain-containing protein n=1 Tax=Tothia fuscella TaxID=1048955 RepID=A0A9P4NTQ2_9PEZI|nr:HET-domain-containing protein [Tothia fuscella]